MDEAGDLHSLHTDYLPRSPVSGLAADGEAKSGGTGVLGHLPSPTFITVSNQHKQILIPTTVHSPYSIYTILSHSYHLYSGRLSTLPP